MWILTDEPSRLINLENVLCFETGNEYVYARLKEDYLLRVKEIGNVSEKDALNEFAQELRQAGVHCIALEQSRDMPET